METIAVFVNDAAHARSVLQPLLQGACPAHWVIVACAPHLTRHAGRWVSKAARRQWHERWAAKVYEEIVPMLRGRARHIETQLAGRPLTQVTDALAARLPGVWLLDARREAPGATLEPLCAGQPQARRWAGPVAAASGLTALLALAD